MKKLLLLFLLLTSPAMAQVGQPVTGGANITPIDCSGTITAGGTAQPLITGFPGLHGFQVMNIDATTGSGEPLWIAFNGTAVAGASGSYPLVAPTATTFAGAGNDVFPSKSRSTVAAGFPAIN